jgi:hypothetical protein
MLDLKTSTPYVLDPKGYIKKEQSSRKNDAINLSKKRLLFLVDQMYGNRRIEYTNVITFNII